MENQTHTSSALMEALQGKTHKPLPLGKYEVKISKAEVVENEKGGYLAMEYTVVSGDHAEKTIKDSRFAQGINILVSRLKSQQEEVNEELSNIDYLQSLVDSEATFDCWKHETAGAGQTFTNYSFREPVEVQGPTIVDDEEVI